MPKVKINTKKLLREDLCNKRKSKLKALINFKMSELGLSDEDMAKEYGITKRAFQNWRRNPGLFKYENIVILSKVLKFTDEEKASIL